MTEYKKRKIEAQRYVINTFAEMLAEAKEAKATKKDPKAAKKLDKIAK